LESLRDHYVQFLQDEDAKKAESRAMQTQTNPLKKLL